MNHSNSIELDDLQGLVRFGHGKLTDTRFLLRNILSVDAAKQWLCNAPVSSADSVEPPPDTALQIAFSVAGLRALGLSESVIGGFSDEFVNGMAGDESRSRRLGDTGLNAPQQWKWGGNPAQVPHLLLLLYATKGGIESWSTIVENESFAGAFQVLAELPTRDMGQQEPFGFKNGISQPVIDWQQQQSTDLYERDGYSNHLAAGEVILGYANEYGEYTARPLIDPRQDQPAAELPNAKDVPSLKDLGRNHPNEDLVASTRFHRLLRRGRGYGPVLSPEEALKQNAPDAERGLQFICLVANISRQFEFVQNAWSMSSKFSGVQRESDPVLGHRAPLMGGERTDQFTRPDPAGPNRITRHLPHFVTVRGGGYFFLPGLRGLKYIASQPGSDGNSPS